MEPDQGRPREALRAVSLAGGANVGVEGQAKAVRGVGAAGETAGDEYHAESGVPLYWAEKLLKFPP